MAFDYENSKANLSKEVLRRMIWHEVAEAKKRRTADL